VLEPEMAAVLLARALEPPGIPAALRVPQRGLLHELLRVIAELESAYLAPPDVAAVAAALPAGASAARLAELGRVYAAYESELFRIDAVDRHGREWRVCEGLAAAEAAGARPPPPDGSIRVGVGPSRYREVEAAGRAIRARLEQGAPPERIALLARDLGVYGDLIEDVCRRYRIPVYFRKGRPLVANGLVKACLDV